MYRSSRSACEPHRETIELGLSKGRNAKGIWQDLVDRSGFAGGYQSVKRFIGRLRGKSLPEACAVIETGGDTALHHRFWWVSRNDPPKSSAAKASFARPALLTRLPAAETAGEL